jgi:hypothetical protein
MDVLKEALDDGDNGVGATAVATGEIDEPFISVDQLLQKVIERGGDVEFTDANKEEYLLEMSNPHLFPYGRGGPGDDFSAHLDLQGSARVAKFASTALQGGGAFKRFQNDFRFIALCYYTSMRKRLSGVSYAAHRKDLDDVSPFQQEAIQMVRDGDQSSAAVPATDHEVASDQVPMVTVEAFKRRLFRSDSESLTSEPKTELKRPRAAGLGSDDSEFETSGSCAVYNSGTATSSTTFAGTNAGDSECTTSARKLVNLVNPSGNNTFNF